MKNETIEAIVNGSKLTKADAGRVINKEKKTMQKIKKQTTK
jgi:hypothetical protein